MLDALNSTRLKNRNRYLIFIILLILTLTSVSICILNKNNVPLAEGTILVLPVNAAGTTADVQWSPYAYMEQVVQNIYSSRHYTVLQVDDVIEVLKRASVAVGQTSTEDIQRIFKVSGATLIIESNLKMTAVTNELTYQVHRRSMIESGHFMGVNVQELFVQLSSLINQITDIKPVNQQMLDGATDFGSSQLDTPDMVQALARLQAGKLTQARTLLAHITDIAPSNIMAKRLLANILIDSREFTIASELLSQAIVQAEEMRSVRELARLRLSLANNLVGQNDVEQALPLLAMAKIDAAKVNDWLYLAYISELSGYVNQRLSRYAVAREQFKMAIKYHQKIHCPFGEVQSLNHLAELELLDRNYSQASRLTKQSLDIVTLRELADLREATLALHTKAENKLQRIR